MLSDSDTEQEIPSGNDKQVIDYGKWVQFVVEFSVYCKNKTKNKQTCSLIYGKKKKKKREWGHLWLLEIQSKKKEEDVSSITGWYFGACTFIIVYIMQ